MATTNDWGSKTTLIIDVTTEDLPTRLTRSSSRSGPRAGSCERRYSETPAHDSCSGSGRTADTASQEQCARKARTRAFVNGECAGSGAAGHLAAPSQSQAAAETPGEWGLAAEGISERWIGWTRLAAVGFNAKKKVLN